MEGEVWSLSIRECGDGEYLSRDEVLATLDKTEPSVLMRELMEKLEGSGLPCGHRLSDLIGGSGSVTKCGACLAAKQAPPAAAPVHSPLWHHFPSADLIRLWPHWWRKNGTRTLQVDLRFEGDDTFVDTGEGPPLCLGSDDSHWVFIGDKWQVRKVADKPLPLMNCKPCGKSYALGEAFFDCPKCGKPMSAL